MQDGKLIRSSEHWAVSQWPLTVCVTLCECACVCVSACLRVCWQGVASICSMLGTIQGWVANWPPMQQPMRFGNRAFRSWHGQLVAVREGAGLGRPQGDTHICPHACVCVSEGVCGQCPQMPPFYCCASHCSCAS